jgi:hypothetical protein
MNITYAIVTSTDASHEMDGVGSRCVSIITHLMSEKRHNCKLSEISVIMVYFITDTNARQSVAAKHETHHHTMKRLNHS